MWGRAWGLQCTNPQAQRLGVDWDLDLVTCCLLLCITWLLNWTCRVEKCRTRVVSTLTTFIFICHPWLQSTSCMGETAAWILIPALLTALRSPSGCSSSHRYLLLCHHYHWLQCLLRKQLQLWTHLLPYQMKWILTTNMLNPTSASRYILSIQLSYNANDWYDFISFSFNQRHERYSRWKNMML